MAKFTTAQAKQCTYKSAYAESGGMLIEVFDNNILIYGWIEPSLNMQSTISEINAAVKTHLTFQEEKRLETHTMHQIVGKKVT